MKDALRLLIATAVLLSAVAVVPAAAQSDGGLELTASGGEADPGETVTVSFSVENTGSATGVVLNVTAMPDGWTVQAHENDGGTWNGNENKWVWLTVDSDETVEPSVTLAVPEDASGEHTVAATASTSETATSAEATVTVSSAGTATDAEAGTSDGSGPGFGAAMTVVALLAVALLARRRQ